MSDSERDTNQRRPERADASAGLDVDALRRKRDRELAARAPVGALSVDVATLWSGRVARYQARREPAAQLAVAHSEPTALWSLPPSVRMRLWHGNRGAVPSRSKVSVDCSSPRGMNTSRRGEPA